MHGVLRGSVAVAILAAAGMWGMPASSEIVDRVMATVDAEVILMSDVMMELAPYQAQSGEAMDSKIGETLEQAIDTKILVREASLKGMEVKDDLVEKRVDELKALYPTNDAFLKEVEKSGETLSDLRTRLRKQLMALKMATDKHDQLAKSVTVTESEVAQYYEDHKGEFQHSERVRVRQIFLEAAEGSAGRDAAKARLVELKQELDNGADFAGLAKAYSQAPGAADGGIVGWIVRGDLVKPLEDVAFTLPEGSLSDVLESPLGYHILKVDKREDAGQASLEEVRAEIEPAIRDQKAGELYDKWMSDLRKRSQVRVFYR